MRPSTNDTIWQGRVAELMVREGKTFQQAANDAGLTFSPEESVTLAKRKQFQKILWTERQRYFKELAGDPERSKTSLLGTMLFLVQKLIDDQDWDKALEGCLKIAKVDGFIGPDASVTIMQQINPQDIAEARKLIEQQLKGRNTPTRVEPDRSSTVVGTA